MGALKRLFGFFFSRSLFIFLIIGGLNTILSYLFSFLLVQYAGSGLYVATAIPYAVLSVPSFYFNRRFSFQSKAPLLGSIIRFTVIIVVCFHLSFLLNNWIVPQMRIYLFPDISEVWYTLIRLLGIQVVFTMLNYIGQRLWAFKEPAPASIADTE